MPAGDELVVQTIAEKLTRDQVERATKFLAERQAMSFEEALEALCVLLAEEHRRGIQLTIDVYGLADKDWKEFTRSFEGRP